MTAPTAAPPDVRELLERCKSVMFTVTLAKVGFDFTELLDDIGTVLSQPPDAKPVYWDPPSDWLKDHEIPPMGSALQKLGSRLADMLQDDDWNNIEQMLFDVARECAAPQPPAGKGEQ
jgi:hypothetical protein